MEISEEDKKRVTDFLDGIFDGVTTWSCFRTQRCSNHRTIDCQRSLDVSFTLFHPSSWNAQGVDIHDPNLRKFNERFNQDKHVHWYTIKVEDPLFRWGKKVLVLLEAEPGDMFYEYLRRQHVLMIPKIRVVPRERSFASRIVVIDQALTEFMKGQ